MQKVSVTIPAYNEADGILLTLEDLNNQTHQDFEVIVVNNNSTDDTAKIVNEFLPSARYPLNDVG